VIGWTGGWQIWPMTFLKMSILAFGNDEGPTLESQNVRYYSDSAMLVVVNARGRRIELHTS
jgi:hypothetical protein